MYIGPVIASYLGRPSVKVQGSSDNLLPGEHFLLMYKGPVMVPYLESTVYQ